MSKNNDTSSEMYAPLYAKSDSYQSFWLEFIHNFFAYFRQLGSKAKPLSARAATNVWRLFIFFALIWLALQGGYLYNAVLLPNIGWLLLFLFSASISYLLAERLTYNLPHTSYAMQLASIIFLGVSLAQGICLGAVDVKFVWLIPLFVLVPSLWLALKRNRESFALLGYASALFVPGLFADITSLTEFIFVYYLVLCLPLPFLAYVRNWRFIHFFVFGCAWLLSAAYLLILYNIETAQYTQPLYIFFLTCYFFTVWVRVRQPGFSLANFIDFSFTVGLALLAALCQLRIFMPHPDGVFTPIILLSLVFLLVAIIGGVSWEKHGAGLSRIYFSISVLLADSAVAIGFSGEKALLIYALQAIIFFWFGSATGMMRVKSAGFIFLLLLPIYFFAAVENTLLGIIFITLAAFACVYVQDRELKRLAMRTGKLPWSSKLEFFLVVYGFVWCFLGLAVISFRHMSSPGLVYLALSSAAAYFFFAVGRFARLRSLRIAIFIPMIMALPAAFLPFVYQTWMEWPEFRSFASYNYLYGVGALAWLAYFVTVWTALYHNWGGLISARLHAHFLALVILELLLVLTSSSRAMALSFEIAPSFLTVLAVLPALFCVVVLSHVLKRGRVDAPYRKPIFLIVPWAIFVALSFWFVAALTSPGSAAPGGRYIPLLNPVEIVQLFAVFVFGYWQRRLQKAVPPLPHLSHGQMLWVYAISAFLFLHSLMFRVVQYFSEASAQEVFSVNELQIIFACIWITFGILIWIVASAYASSLSWAVGAVVLATGFGALVYLSLQIWGNFVAIVMVALAFGMTSLLIWRSPVPFTKRGIKAARQSY